MSQVTGSSRPGGSGVPSFCPIWSRLWSDQDRLRTGSYLGRQTASLSPSHRCRTGYLLAPSPPPPRGAREASWPTAPSNEIRPGSRHHRRHRTGCRASPSSAPGAPSLRIPRVPFRSASTPSHPCCCDRLRAAVALPKGSPAAPVATTSRRLSSIGLPGSSGDLLAAPACASMPPGRSTGGRLMLDRSARRAASSRGGPGRRSRFCPASAHSLGRRPRGSATWWRSLQRGRGRGPSVPRCRCSMGPGSRIIRESIWGDSATRSQRREARTRAGRRCAEAAPDGLSAGP